MRVVAPLPTEVHLWQVVDFMTLTTTAPCAQMIEATWVSSLAHAIDRGMLPHHSTRCADVPMLDLLPSCPDRRARAVRARQMLRTSQNWRSTHGMAVTGCVCAAGASESDASCTAAVRC